MTHSDNANRKQITGQPNFVGICLVFLLLSTGTLFAQTSDNKNGVGLGFGLWHVAEDQDYSSEGSPLNFFFDWDITRDWLKIRVGYNTTTANLMFDHYNKSWESDLTTQNVYVAYRYKYDLRENLQAFGMAGLSLMHSNFRMNNGAENYSASGMGTVVGGGIFYFFSNFGFGAQLDIFSGSGDFNGVTISTGSTQLRIVAVNTF